MRSLYIKIFLACWLVMMLVTATNFLLTWALSHQFDSSQLENQQIAEYAEQAVASYQNEGRTGLRNWRQTLAEETGLLTLLLNDKRRNLGGGPLPRFLREKIYNFDDSLPYLHFDNDDQQHREHRTLRHNKRWRPLLWPITKDGQDYLFVVLNPTQLLDHLHSGMVMFWRVSLPFLLVGGIALLLTRYLVRPIRQLQQASRQLAQGQLDTRVGEQLGVRRDELGQLGQDFDQMAEQIQQLINNQKQLLRDVSHELRTPLARQRVALELARKELGDSVRLDRIEQQAEQVDQLIEEILTLSRLDPQGTSLDKQSVDLNQLLQSIIDEFEPDHPSRIDWNPGPSQWLSVNETLIRRALSNVIGNAIKYSEAEVQLEVRSDNGHCCIRISDQGPGVEEDMLEQIFKPFVRTDKARSRQQGGWGLGLAIAARSVRQHQGKINAKNLQPQGLQIEIKLPV